MKQFRVDVDFRVTKCIFVDAETAEQAEEIVEQRCKDNPYQYTSDPDACTDYSSCDVNEDDEPDKPMSFRELCDKLCYFSVVACQHKTIGEIADECRAFIRKSGHQCLDEGFDQDADAKEWAAENYPEWDNGEIEQSDVLYQPLEFLCKGEYDGEPCFGQLDVSFYGDYDKGVGVFSVSTD